MKFVRRAVTATCLVGGAALVAVAPSGAQYGYPSPTPSPTAKPASNRVDVVDFAFRPKTLHVSKGSTVTWTWKGSAPHNVTFNSLHKHSNTQSHGSYRLKFTRAGTFHYLCTIHHFTGTIVVR
jgi:plastocyanin